MPTKRLFQLLLFLALGVTLIATTSQSDYSAATGINDKVAHIITFLLLALLAQQAFPHLKMHWRPYLWLMVYGLGIEVIQYFLPTRGFSLLDLAADGIGLLIALIFMLTLRQAKHVR